MKTKNKIFIFLLIFILISQSVCLLFALPASAGGHTSPLEDLEEDGSFNAADYPAIEGDYSIQVIHLGETEDGELLVYTYQPGNNTKHFKAKFVSLSFDDTVSTNIQYSLYPLTWVGNDGVFDKYIVNNVTVSSEPYRYYNIGAIYRPYDSSIDTSSEAVDTVQCVGYGQAQAWCAYYYNNVLVYEREDMDYVDINIKATGTIRYSEGWKLYDHHCDSHYVAFSVDNFDVEKIYDADISYTATEYFYTLDLKTGEDHTTVLNVNHVPSIKLTDKEVGSNDGNGLFGKKYQWYRITDVSTFVKQVEDDSNDRFSDEERTALSQCQFVFRFLETDYSGTLTESASTARYSTVSDIGILRLHFLSKGRTYNLGCVSDLVGTDSTPELVVDSFDDLLNTIEERDWWQKLMMVLMLILLLWALTFLSGPLGRVFKFIWKCIKAIFKVLVWLISLPGRFLSWILDKLGKRKRRKPQGNGNKPNSRGNPKGG